MPSTLHHTDSFELNYLRLRMREGRVYSDLELEHLPDIPKSHPLSREWLIRKSSCRRLKKYVESKKQDLQILEIGTGNGWFANQLAQINGTNVLGIDINSEELEQAKRVFINKKNLQFTYGDIREGTLESLRFDIIFFAASFQYFPEPSSILHICMEHLNFNGEIHLIDTLFYDQLNSWQARERSKDYFEQMQCPEMEDYYFHHRYHDLTSFKYETLYHPLNNRFIKFSRNPFPWIRIRKQ